MELVYLSSLPKQQPIFSIFYLSYHYQDYSVDRYRAQPLLTDLVETHICTHLKHRYLSPTMPSYGHFANAQMRYWEVGQTYSPGQVCAMPVTYPNGQQVLMTYQCLQPHVASSGNNVANPALWRLCSR
ncbi:hypothetical protein CYLTODRAFT_420220 [Cylindrobasidium torrendii FP15055 ss-10]|uniref:Uncharacterized protein n=1 Tax=Cylindrobasidium torrendii FP15055 ss-10 TaxID=1314674 RepID=A0A0D7BHF9_9AGAR|nr:hypothetical protein CYLTODRAFT_420220 [Cylindrobasidium torrendii FP15055 ss-10]